MPPYGLSTSRQPSRGIRAAGREINALVYRNEAILIICRAAAFLHIGAFTALDKVKDFGRRAVLNRDMKRQKRC